MNASHHQRDLPFVAASNYVRLRRIGFGDLAARWCVLACQRGDRTEHPRTGDDLVRWQVSKREMGRMLNACPNTVCNAISELVARNVVRMTCPRSRQAATWWVNLTTIAAFDDGDDSDSEPSGGIEIEWPDFGEMAAGGQPVVNGGQGGQPVVNGGQGGQPVVNGGQGGQPVVNGGQGGQPRVPRVLDVEERISNSRVCVERARTVTSADQVVTRSDQRVTRGDQPVTNRGGPVTGGLAERLRRPWSRDLGVTDDDLRRAVRVRDGTILDRLWSEGVAQGWLADSHDSHLAWLAWVHGVATRPSVRSPVATLVAIQRNTLSTAWRISQADDQWAAEYERSSRGQVDVEAATGVRLPTLSTPAW